MSIIGKTPAGHDVIVMHDFHKPGNSGPDLFLRRKDGSRLRINTGRENPYDVAKEFVDGKRTAPEFPP